jgi:DNA-binding XRE family transcriptional regulator
MQGTHEKDVMNNLKAMRKAQKLSLWGLAARAKTSPTTLSAIEKWDYQPGADLRQRIAMVLGVNVTEIWPENTAEKMNQAL